MKSAIFLLALSAVVFSSCTTAYKTGQTPDDVYYSPARPEVEYVQTERRQDRNYYEGSEDYYTDRYLRMRVTNRYRWSAFDDYYNNPYLYSPYASYGHWWSPWNSYWAWNSYCNPYYGGVVVIKNPGTFIPPSRAAVFNPNSYINNTPQPLTGTKGINSGTYSGSRSNGSNGGSTRYNNSNRYSGSRSSNNSNSYTPSSSTPSRSYTPSSGSSSGSSRSSSSSSSSGSSGSSSRPPR